MKRNATGLVRDELERISIADEQGFLEYLPLAARLAALGDPEPLARWPELAQPFADRLDSLLVERSEEGIWDLEQSVGEDLGLAVIDAQDYYCFLRRERGILPKQCRRMLTAWVERAEQTALDEAAAILLRRFRRRFPLPLADRLAVVDDARSFGEESILAALARPCPVVEWEWPRLSADVPALAELGQLDAGTPSDRLKRIFERLNVRVEMPMLGDLALSRRIDDQWRVVIDVERSDGSVPDVEMIRLGLVPGQRARDNKGRWRIDLRPWEHMQRVRMMESPLVIGFRNSYRLRVR